MSWRKGRKPKHSIWRVVRLRALDRDCWKCVICKRSGKLEVDHVIPLEDGGEMYELSGLQSLCRGCHISKTSKENQYRQSSPEMVEWMQWLANAANNSV